MYKQQHSFYHTNKSPNKIKATLQKLKRKVLPRKPNMIEITPIESINARVNSHMRNSGFYKPEMFEQAYKYKCWQFKNRLNSSLSPVRPNLSYSKPNTSVEKARKNLNKTLRSPGKNMVTGPLFSTEMHKENGYLDYSDQKVQMKKTKHRKAKSILLGPAQKRASTASDTIRPPVSETHRRKLKIIIKN